MGRLRRRPSPALVVACLALAVALGGTGYAAMVLPANSVGTKQLRNGAVVAGSCGARGDAVLVPHGGASPRERLPILEQRAPLYGGRRR